MSWGPRSRQRPGPQGTPDVERYPMTILYDCTRPVKCNRPFGLDEIEMARVFGPISDARDQFELADSEDAIDEAAALEAAALDAIECGMFPPDLADYLSRTSLVGHPA